MQTIVLDNIFNILDCCNLVDLIRLLQVDKYIAAQTKLHPHTCEYLNIQTIACRCTAQPILLNWLRVAVKKQLWWVGWQIYDMTIQQYTHKPKIIKQVQLLLYQYCPLNSTHPRTRELCLYTPTNISLRIARRYLCKNITFIELFISPLDEMDYNNNIIYLIFMNTLSEPYFKFNQMLLKYIRRGGMTENILKIHKYLSNHMNNQQNYLFYNQMIASCLPRNPNYIDTFSQLLQYILSATEYNPKSCVRGIYSLLQIVVQAGRIADVEQIWEIADKTGRLQNFKLHMITLFRTACYCGHLDIAKWIHSIDPQQFFDTYRYLSRINSVQNNDKIVLNPFSLRNGNILV